MQFRYSNPQSEVGKHNDANIPDGYEAVESSTVTKSILWESIDGKQFETLTVNSFQ